MGISESAAASEPVFRVVRLVATSAHSWEDAARRGVAEAVKTSPDVRAASVTDMDTLIVDGAVVLYRLKLELALQIDRVRPNPVTGRPAVTVHRCLIVANKTLAGDILPEHVATRVAAGPTEIHLLVPASRSKETQRLISGATDPLSGYTMVSPEDLAVARARDVENAEERLATFLDRLSDFSDVLTSEVGDQDPLAAISRVLERSSFDEIIISMLPGSVSRWLKMDLPSRVERTFGLPVVVINPPNQPPSA